MSEITKDGIQEVMEAVTQLREHNDKLIAAKADGKAVGDLTHKVESISNKLDAFEGLNQKLTTSEATAKAMQEQLDAMQVVLNRAAAGGGSKADLEERNAKLSQAFNRVMRTRDFNRDPQDVALLKQYQNTLVKGDDQSAGYLLAPPEVERAIQRLIIETSPIRSLATIQPIGGHSYKFPKELGLPSAKRIGEIETRTDGSDPVYGMGEFQAPEMFSRNRISQQMLEDSDYDLPGELTRGVGIQMGVKEGTESVSGDGNNAQQMEGMLKASGVGEVVSGNASAITADGLINLYYELKTAYTGNARWLMNRKTVRDLRKLKDGQGNYLWAPGYANGVPNTIQGAPYVEFPDMPDIGAGTYPVIWGDIRTAYTIVDRVGLGFLVDYVTQADNGLVVYRGRKRVGGGVRQADALKKLKIST
jgi:HK97 family phage major capsid protein